MSKAIRVRFLCPCCHNRLTYYIDSNVPTFNYEGKEAFYCVCHYCDITIPLLKESVKAGDTEGILK